MRGILLLIALRNISQLIYCVSMSVVEEGFICPYCLVGFATSGKLQSHFVEMHSGKEAGVCCEGDGDLVGVPVGYGQLGGDEVSFACCDFICAHIVLCLE